MQLLQYIQRYYNLDYRALALLRMSVALVCLIDLSIRLTDLSFFYTNEGFWNTHVMYNLGWQEGFWSLHALIESQTGMCLLFALHISTALLMFFGGYTRISTFLTFLLYVSLHNRNLFVLQAGDDLLRITLFWGIFLNWGATYSLDAKRTKKNPQSPPLASLAYLLLIASVYFFTVLLKNDKEWHSEGSALYYALSLEQMRLPIGDIVYTHAMLLKILTHSVYFMELSLPFLILWPSQKGTPRLLAFLIVLILHLSIGLTLYVGLFFVISIATSVGLLPGFVFDSLERRLNLTQQHPSENRLRIQFKHILVFFLVSLCLLINFSSLEWFPYQPQKNLRVLSNTLRLNQYWGMFSPGILKKDGWLVYHGIDSLGRQWDLRFNAEYVDYSKPKHLVALFKNDRWRKLSENMQNEKFLFLRHLYASAYLKHWNRQHPEKPLKTLYLYFMEQENLANYHKTQPKKILYALATAP